MEDLKKFRRMAFSDGLWLGVWEFEKLSFCVDSHCGMVSIKGAGGPFVSKSSTQSSPKVNFSTRWSINWLYSEFREELSRNPKQKVAIMDADKPQNYKIGAFLSAVETSQLQGWDSIIATSHLDHYWQCIKPNQKGKNHKKLVSEFTSTFEWKSWLFKSNGWDYRSKKV